MNNVYNGFNFGGFLDVELIHIKEPILCKKKIGSIILLKAYRSNVEARANSITLVINLITSLAML